MRRFTFFLCCAILITVIITATPIGASYPSDGRPRVSTDVVQDLALAIHYAPVWRQDTDPSGTPGVNGTADYITNFDFDGDWIANNNWNNLNGMTPLLANIYYSVIETESHWFVLYADFHPRDWFDVCWSDIPDPDCHENDMEGALVGIRKVPGSTYGEFHLMATQAHGHWETYTQDDVEFENSHPTLFVEANGHGVYAWDGGNFPGGDGVIYRYTNGIAQQPANYNDRNVDYGLRSIDELWSRRYCSRIGQVFYHENGNGHLGFVFDANDWVGNPPYERQAKPPWGWPNGGVGDVFWDPVAFSRDVFPDDVLGPNFSNVYLNNPYQNASQTGECTEPTFEPAIDVYLLVDLTGSFEDDLPIFKAQAPSIITDLLAAYPNTHFGLGKFEDYPILPFGSAPDGDQAYERLVDLTSDTAAVLGTINGLFTRNGEDHPESQLAALYQAASGAGQDLSGVGYPGASIPPNQQANFRDGATKIFLLWTDASFHHPGDPGNIPYPGPSFAETVNAILALDPPKVIGISSGGGGVPDLQAMATATDALAPADGVDCDGDGTIDLQEGEPMVCSIASSGIGIAEAIVALVQAAAALPFADAGGPYSSTIGQAVLFDGSNSYDPDGSIVLYEWDFDNDGVFDFTSPSPTATHVYNAMYAGVVALRVTDNDGNTATDTAAVTVTAPVGAWRFHGYTLRGSPGEACTLSPLAAACVPQPGVTVELYVRNEGQPWPTTPKRVGVSDGSGFYHFTEVEFDYYRIVEVDPTGYTSTGIWAAAPGVIIDANTIEYNNPSQGVHHSRFWDDVPTPTPTATLTPTPTPTSTPTPTPLPEINLWLPYIVR